MAPDAVARTPGARVPGAVRWSVALGVLLGLALLVTPTMGTDLSAQVARADFFAAHGWRVLDLRWYGGTVQFGYSWTSPAVLALLGVRLTGALALVASAAAFGWLLVRCAVPRPLLGALLGCVAFAGNLVSGRVTFALGVACGLWALLALTVQRPAWLRYGGAALGGLLASATSPVAGLFVGVAAVAVLVGSRASWRGALVLGSAAAVPLGLTALLFSDGGEMNLGRNDTLRALLTGVAVALLVRHRAVRAGALLAAAGVLAAFLVATPVGLNATRLATMFALPIVAAMAALSWRFLAPVLLALAIWQPPVILADVADAGNPSAERSYYAPLLAELDRRRAAGEVIGRIEVPPTRDYWEAAYLAARVPLARGWLRQVDIARNRLFFDASLTAGEYEHWLRDNGVRYVAVPDAEGSWVGRSERAVIASGPAYLSETWRSEHWVLYAVGGEPSIVEGAPLVGSTPVAVTFEAERGGPVLVRLRYSRWLRVDGGARIQPDRRWSVVVVPRAGRYTVRSA